MAGAEPPLRGQGAALRVVRPPAAADRLLLGLSTSPTSFSESSSSSDCLPSPTPPRLIVEIGAGVALPTCALARSFAEAASEADAGDTVATNPAAALTRCNVSLVVTDVFPSITTNAARNVRRQLSYQRRVALPSSMNALAPATARCSSASFRTELVDFFKVEAYVETQRGGGEKTAGDEMSAAADSHPNPLLCGSCDLVLATDIVYDFHVGRAGIATLATLLRPCAAGRLLPTVCAGSSSSSPSTSQFHFSSIDDVLMSWRDGKGIFEATSEEDDAVASSKKEKSRSGGGGIALISCESHRDAMPLIYDFFTANSLVVLWHERNAQSVLRHYAIPAGVTVSSCELFVVARAGICIASYTSAERDVPARLTDRNEVIGKPIDTLLKQFLDEKDAIAKGQRENSQQKSNADD